MSYVLGACFPYTESLAAARSAAALAEALNCPLMLVHAYNVPYVVGEFPVPVVSPDDQRAQAAQHLEATAAAIRNGFPDLGIDTHLGYGILAEVIQDKVEQSPPLVCVIANDTPADSHASLGSNTAEAAGEISAPLLAVPEGNETAAPSHVCLALMPESLNEGVPLAGLHELWNKLKFRLSVVSVSEGEAAPTSDGISGLRAQLDRMGASIHILPVDEAELSLRITAFAKERGADCLAVLKHDRGFWASLFHKSQTEELLREAALPVLALHPVSA